MWWQWINWLFNPMTGKNSALRYRHTKIHFNFDFWTLQLAFYWGELDGHIGKYLYNTRMTVHLLGQKNTNQD